MKYNILPLTSVTLLLLLLITSASVYAQTPKTTEPDFRIQTEYRDDSLGRAIIPIPLEEMEYHRITANDNSSWGYGSRTGKIIIPLGKYKFLNPIDEHGMILAHKNGKEGFIDITEKVLIPFIYDDVGVFSTTPDGDLAPAIRNGKQGFINRRGEEVIPPEYDAASYVTYFYQPGAAILMKDGKFGVIDSRNNVLIPFEHEKIKWSDNRDYFIVTRGKDQWTAFSLDGRQLSDYTDYIVLSETNHSLPSADAKDLPILVTTEESERRLNSIYTDMNFLNSPMHIRDSIEASLGGDYAYMDKTQKMIVPFGVYDRAEPFGLGRKAIVARKGAYGLIDEKGKLVLPLEYDLIEHPVHYSHYANIFLATKGREVTVFDKDAQVVPVERIASYILWNGDIFITGQNGKVGLLDFSGQQTIPFAYDTLYHPRDGAYIARRGEKYGYIGPENEIIRPLEYRYIYSLKDGVALVDADGKVGMYNHEGDILILPFEYEAIHNTYYNTFEDEEPRFVVGKGGKVGTVDINNQVVIPIIYDALSGWVEYGPEAHFARLDGKYGLVSHEGEVIIPLEYDYVNIPLAGVIIVRKDEKYGVISWQNKEILPCIYERIFDDMPYFRYGEEEKDDKLVTLRDGVWSYFDLEGKVIQKDVPKEEILKHYDYRLEWGEPSNEEGFDMKEAKIIYR